MKKASVLLFTLLAAALIGTSLAQETGGAMLPVGATEGTVETADGASIYYQTQGEGDPMLLIHGYPLNSGLFRDNVGPLAEQYQVITVDLRGFGQSTSPSEEGSIETYATDVFAVMDELELEQAIVGGMSMGGITAFEMYRGAPERFSALVLIDTVHLPAAIFEAAMWRGMGEQAQAEGVASLVDPLLPDMLSGRARSEQPELAEYLTELVEAASVEGAVGGGEALAARPDSTDTLAQITVPTLIIVGQEDALTPFEVHEEMNEGILNSELVIIPGAAHAANFEASDETNAAILEWASELE